MRKLSMVMLMTMLFSWMSSVYASPTTSLPPAPPPSAFIHQVNSQPASVHFNKKTNGVKGTGLKKKSKGKVIHKEKRIQPNIKK